MIEMAHYRTNITAEPFSMPVMQKIIKRVMKKIAGVQKISIIDPFARNHRQLGCVTISNDLNPIFKTSYNLEMNDFGEEMKELVLQGEIEKVDLLFHDPPYSLRKLKE